MQKSIRSIRDLNLRNNAVFLRVDFNVPIEGGKVTDSTRIEEALPTIEYALAQNAKLVLASHLGRPGGRANHDFTLEPVADELARLLNREVMIADDCVGEGIELMIKSLRTGHLVLLENLRFHPGEESNDPEFSHKLARLAQVYVNDAFGTAHRKHASTYGVAELIPQRGMGFLIEKELEFLDGLLHAPSKPFWTVLGGAKVSDKIKTVISLLERVQGLCIGGRMAFAFLAARGIRLPEGAKIPEVVEVDAAKRVLRDAERRGIAVVLPTDFNQSFDIGPLTLKLFQKALAPAATIFWNGPLGKFEDPSFAHGTFELARTISELKATKVVGGGDTVAAIKQAGCAQGFDHLSTGGGAVLEYLEGQSLPGIEVLWT